MYPFWIITEIYSVADFCLLILNYACFKPGHSVILLLGY